MKPDRNQGGSGRKRTKRAPAKRRTTRSQTTSLLLRDIAPDVLAVLRARAERSGRSLQQELHVALRRDVRRNFDEAAAISRAWQDRLRDRALPDSTDLLREDRGR